MTNDKGQMTTLDRTVYLRRPTYVHTEFGQLAGFNHAKTCVTVRFNGKNSGTGK
jgi:hypothetical protein